MLLEDAMEKIIDYRGKTPKKQNHGIPLITAKIIKDGRLLQPTEFLAEDYYDEWMRRGLPEPGDVVLTVEAPLGQVAQIPNFKVGLAQRVVTLRGKRDLLDNSFLKYYLMSPKMQATLSGHETGTTVTGIKQSTLRKIDISFPELSTQKAIAHILGTLDDKIELNQKMNQTLEEIAKAIFKSWFVDFDPVQAKAEGRPTGLPPEISDLFPDELVDSEIGKIPKGWTVQPLSEQIRVNPKHILKKGTDAYFVEMKCLSESTASVSAGYLRSFTSGSKFQRFDTLFARITPCLENGKIGLLLNASVSEVCWGSTEFIVLSPKDDQSPLFPYCRARDENLRAAAVSSMTGSSGRQRVPNDFFDRYLVANPGSSVHQIFAKIADPIMKRIQVCGEEITTLSELRDTLLPKLISGELRIPDAEKFLEEAGV